MHHHGLLHDSACGRTELGEAEVEQLCASRGEHDVGRLQVAMDDPVAVRVIERAGDLDRADQRLVERQSPGREPLGQRVAFDVLHDEKVDLVLASDIVERADMRVREGGDCPRFAGEAGAHLFIACVTCRAGP